MFVENEKKTQIRLLLIVFEQAFILRLFILNKNC